MINAFETHLQQHFPLLWQKRIILAISGGVDSVVLAHLLHELGIPFLMAHCNFQLRGEESEGDQHFVETLAKELSVPIAIKRFETKTYGGLKGLLGIPAENAHVLRPLLPFSREEILAFAQERGICWREDSSNGSDAYTRNKIRHHLSPILK